MIEISKKFLFKKVKVSNFNQQKKYIIDTKRWISATRTKNYMLKDPVCDYFDILNKKGSNTRNFNNKNIESDNTLNFLFNQGNIFEKNILNELKNKFNPREIVCVNEKFNNIKYLAYSKDAFNYTVECIKNKIPIIYSGVLHSPTNEIFGMPDLIIRRDYMNKIFDEYIINTSSRDNNMILSKHPTSNKLIVKKRYDTILRSHKKESEYVIVDIKFATLYLSSNGRNILNRGLIPAYKSQLYIYTLMLNEHQTISASDAYILGRGYSYLSKRQFYEKRDPFCRPGVINFTDYDILIPDQTNDAVKWLREIEENWKTFTLSPPSRIELMPNMCNVYDSPHRSKKEELANINKDITKLWMCGIKHRDYAYKNYGIMMWNDKRCNSYTLGFSSESYISNTINSILSINLRKNKFIEIGDKSIIPKSYVQEKEFYIDIENLSNVCADDSFSSQMIFIIGVYSIDNDIPTYTSFKVDNLTKNEETKIVSQFIDYLKYKSYGYKDIILYHWGAHEKSKFNKVDIFSKFINNATPDNTIKFVDICNIFKKSPITIKDCFSFGLKDIANSMIKHNLILHEGWKNERIVDGMNAVISLYNSKDFNKVMNTIESYNRIDCEIIYHILKYIRSC